MKRKILLTFICFLSIIYVMSFSSSAQETESFFESNLTEDNTDATSIERFSVNSYYELPNVDASILSTTTTYVYTPNGSAVTVLLRTEGITNTNALDMDREMKGAYSGIVSIYRASNVFNCHSYAWYSQNYESNVYWMNDPYKYVSDLSYTRYNEPQVGDIIVYLNSAGYNLHSGIVVQVHEGNSNGVCGDSNLVMVQSKWGDYGLYEHRGDQCPYPDLGATTVQYYRRTNHTHTFAKSNYDSTWHKKYCTGCGVTIWEEHDYSILTTKNSTSHTVSCACGASITEPHSLGYQDYNEYYHKKYCACGYSSYTRHTFEYTYTNAQVHTKTCSLCDGSYQDPHYEEAYSVEDNGDGTHDITCICQGIFDEEASHVYNEYDYYNGVYHKISCICGDYELEAHELSYISLDNSYHWEECDICGYENEIEHDFTSTITYYNSLYHTAACFCGFSQRVPHDEYYETTHDKWYHTLQITCCGTHSVTGIHHFDDYDSDSHTGECSFCSYVATTDLAHVVPYCDDENGYHTGKCRWCDYTHTEPHTYMYTYFNYQYHQVDCEECDEYQVLEEHNWDDGYVLDGRWGTFCTDCEYVLWAEPLTLDMIAKLPIEVQNALQSAKENALLNATENQSELVMIKMNDEIGILYRNGEYYLVHYPEIPDAELLPTPNIPGEGSVS